MRRVLMTAGLAVALSGCGDAFTGRVDVAATAGPYELSVDQLAEVIALGPELPIQREVAEGIAMMWVDYTTFADRLLDGVDFTDSGYVAAAMWAEIQQELADRYHDQLMEAQVELDSAQIDSVYAAGDLRFIRHILFRVEAGASAEVRAVKQRLAQDIYEKLTSGELTWAAASELNEDATTAEQQGSLGLLAHGEMVPSFENAAYELAPGGISPVVETAEGYHIIFRPELAQVRAAFAQDVQRWREQVFDDEFLAALPEKWDLDVRSGIAPAVRELGTDPMRAKTSGKVLGTYRDGRFRVSDVARWLQGMPIQMRRQLATASDSQVTRFVTGLMTNHVLVLEAREAGVTLSPAFMAEMTDQLRRQLALVSALLGFPIDTLPALRALPPEARQDSVRVRVLDYLRAISAERKRMQTVPPFLADTLRADADWELEPAGIERVLSRAGELRALMGIQPSPQRQTPQPTMRPAPGEPLRGNAR